MSTKVESCIYSGEVMHRRVHPTQHQFSYQIYLWFIKLDELQKLATDLKKFHVAVTGTQAFRFNESDYVPNEYGDLSHRVLTKINSLSETELAGDIFFLGQIRCFGLYFSPVNFYFLRDNTNTFSHMLAEVSNTPWNERHYYLVDLRHQENTEKMFHVSPFNPMDMIYKWSIQQPSTELNLQLACYKNNKHFEAVLAMEKLPLDNCLLRKLLFKVPSMTIKTIVGIYWQALKLFIKRTPIYNHPFGGKQKGNSDVA